MIPKDMLQRWIVEDLTKLLPVLNDNRYEIFKDIDELDRIADNIKSLVEQS
jgi:hypothetical protein